MGLWAPYLLSAYKLEAAAVAVTLAYWMVIAIRACRARPFRWADLSRALVLGLGYAITAALLVDVFAAPRFQPLALEGALWPAAIAHGLLSLRKGIKDTVGLIRKRWKPILLGVALVLPPALIADKDLSRQLFPYSLALGLLVPIAWIVWLDVYRKPANGPDILTP